MARDIRNLEREPAAPQERSEDSLRGGKRASETPGPGSTGIAAAAAIDDSAHCARGRGHSELADRTPV